jgi:hypothetical protein
MKGKMKPIFNGSGADVSASTRTFLKANRQLPMADLYHLVMVGGAQSRNSNGFVARWTDRDYPILSSYMNNHAPVPVRWPLFGSPSLGIFYPQRIKRGSIDSRVGLNVATFDVEVFTNDSPDSIIKDVRGILKPPDFPTDLSIPAYRDAFSLLTADLSSVVETIKEAAWKGELESVYFFIYRGFMSADNGNVDTLGVMPLFTGYVKQFEVSRLSVKFQVSSLIDIFTTTQTPTQVIGNSDRGGDIVVPITSLPSVSGNILSGTTTLKIVGDGGPPPSLVEIDGEQHAIPPSGPFTVAVLNSGANFVADLAVVFSSTGLALAKVGGSPAAGQYAVSGTGVYTFNSADAGKGIAISYTFNDTAGGTLANGILVVTYGGWLTRPNDSRIIRQIYDNQFVGGQNLIYLFEPLPVLPNPSGGDTFAAYQAQAADSTQSIFGKGFQFVPKPESAL